MGIFHDSHVILGYNETTLNSTLSNAGDNHQTLTNILLGVILAACFLILFAACSLIPGLRNAWYPMDDKPYSDEEHGRERRIGTVDDIPVARIEMATACTIPVQSYSPRIEQHHGTIAVKTQYRPLSSTESLSIQPSAYPIALSVPTPHNSQRL